MQFVLMLEIRIPGYRMNVIDTINVLILCFYIFFCFFYCYESVRSTFRQKRFFLLFILVILFIF